MVEHFIIHLLFYECFMVKHVFSSSNFTRFSGSRTERSGSSDGTWLFFCLYLFNISIQPNLTLRHLFNLRILVLAHKTESEFQGYPTLHRDKR